VRVLVDVTAGWGGFLSVVFAADEAGVHSLLDR
jgi:hypothetical protein